MTEFSETQLVSRKTVINTPCTLASYPTATLPPHLSSPSDPLHVPAHAQAGLERECSEENWPWGKKKRV